MLLGAPIYSSAYDPESDTVYAAVNSVFYGPSIRRSPDGGDTWDKGGRGFPMDQTMPKWMACARGDYISGQLQGIIRLG